MTGCERCNTVNTAKRHVYIVLFKGDDSDFAWNQNIEITLETEMDLTGFRAKFSFMDFTQEFADITSKKLVLVFPATATSSFPLGAADASIVLYDSDGKARTIANRIHMIVTKCVDEAYANEDPQAITVSISSSMEREQADWDETDTQSPSYIRNKPEIPTIDETLTQSGEAADAKAVGDALRSGFTEWEFSGSGYDPSTTHIVTIDEYDLGGETVYIASLDGEETVDVDSLDVTSITFPISNITATRHLITPTKTSQLTNDGAPNGDGTPYATTAQIPTVPSAYTSTPEMDGVGSAGSSNAWAKGNHVHPSDTSKVDGDAIYPEWMADPQNPYPGRAIVSHNGYLYQLGEEYAGTDSEPGVSEEWGAVRLESLKQDALSSTQLANIAAVPNKANATDMNAALALKANLTDLPYRLVEPGKWEFSDPQGLTNFAVTSIEYYDGYWDLNYTSDETASDTTSSSGSENATSVVFYVGVSGEIVVTATRQSLPGHLCDRAGNRMEVSGDTTLTLPAAVPGHLRDFIVRLEISGSTVPTITFAAPTGETIAYETDGDEFPVPDEAGTWLYAFTETAASTFAVALKAVFTVAAPTQGGS